MPRVAIITDSSADLSPDLAAREGIIVVPVEASVADDLVPGRETEDAERSVRPELVRAFQNAFADVGQSSEGAVAVLLSSRLGGVVTAANEARASFAGNTAIEIVDSRSASLGLGFQALHAAERTREGVGTRQLADELRAGVHRYHVVFLVDSLEHLRQSGRIGRSAAMIATALQLKPLLRIDEGQIVPYERVRTRPRAVAELANFVSELPAVERCAVLHSGSEHDAHKLAEAVRVEAAIAPDRLSIFEIGDTVARHVGPGALGIAVVEADAW